MIVSGAGGFVGLPVLARLARADTDVHALCTRDPPPALAGVRWHRVDLADGAAVERLMGELAPERLVHLAWCTEHGRFWHAPENVSWVERSLCLLRAFVRHGGRRLVMLGTCAEYDWRTAAGPLVESSSPLAPTTLYGIAKDALRRLAGAYAEQQGVEFAWGRLFLLYGPREAPGRLVPSVVRSLLAGQPVATGGSERVRDLMHVDDVAGAVVALLDSPVVGAVNIASGVGVTVGELLDRIVAITGRGELVRRGALPDRPGEPPLLVADVARLREEVGYRPRVPLSDGLASAVSWWRSAEAERAAAKPAAEAHAG
ncbi:MAG TPA: NAD(P)-dependent oxidoreductase [Solirubrobacteraceae bacterium]|nr:NAD(P)-dependent oxidoreductase [Solirubrobacteraceae bacterium]